MKLFDDLHAFFWDDPSANNCNTFFIDGSKKILLDPGHHHLFGHVRDNLEKLSLGPEDIDLVVITHGHPDHIEAIQDFSKTSALIALHTFEWDFIKNHIPHYGESTDAGAFEPDVFLQDGDLDVGDHHFEVIHSPGHSPGSACLYWQDRKVLFTGDVVFNQGVGRTDLPGGDGEQLKESIRYLSGLDVEYLLTGHGDIVTGREAVIANFSEIERVWFAYL
jgi:glyoxylase-like metal-dependent hydrolase (beta-lactamase superfamily II)